MPSNNASLNAVRRAANDHFWTRQQDVERELTHHLESFRGKTIYCNCDEALVGVQPLLRRVCSGGRHMGAEGYGGFAPGLSGLCPYRENFATTEPGFAPARPFARFSKRDIPAFRKFNRDASRIPRRRMRPSAPKRPRRETEALTAQAQA